MVTREQGAPNATVPALLGFVTCQKPIDTCPPGVFVLFTRPSYGIIDTLTLFSKGNRGLLYFAFLSSHSFFINILYDSFVTHSLDEPKPPAHILADTTSTSSIYKCHVKLPDSCVIKDKSFDFNAFSLDLKYI